MSALLTVATPMPVDVLLLAPSFGLGGGIERYVDSVEWAFKEQGVRFKRIDLSKPGVAGHAQLRLDAIKYLEAGDRVRRIVVAHRALMPVASLIARRHDVSGISVICHGSDVWGARYQPRWWLENYLMQRPRSRIVAVSSFTSGSVSGNRSAVILPPGLRREWFNMLVQASNTVPSSRTDIRLLTVFRLADWRDKGLPELLDAVASMRRSDIHLTVCGSGKPPGDLLEAVSRRRYCTLLPALSDSELAHQFAGADLLVLATRTRSGSQPSGEGFGLVLLEAQVAGTPVVAPAYGGSHDAYIGGLTGVAPTDESADGLVVVLNQLLSDRDQLTRMSRRAAEWARERFAPDHYAQMVTAKLL